MPTMTANPENLEFMPYGADIPMGGILGDNPTAQVMRVESVGMDDEAVPSELVPTYPLPPRPAQPEADPDPDESTEPDEPTDQGRAINPFGLDMLRTVNSKTALGILACVYMLGSGTEDDDLGTRVDDKLYTASETVPYNSAEVASLN